MSALSPTSVIYPRRSFLSSPLPINPHNLHSLIFKPLKPPHSCRSSISRNFVADCGSRTFGLLHSECGEQSGTMTAVVPKYAEIVVVRHGETEWNNVQRIQGHLDVDLNDAGREQAVAVANRLSKEPKISAVYSSDLNRAFVTAETIAKSCGVLEVVKEPDLRERNLGDIQGLLYPEISKVNPVSYKAFVSTQHDEEIPGGGESLNQLYKRCTSALERIAKKHIGERVVVVSHGGTIRALYRRASPHRRLNGKVLNTSISIFHVSDEGEWCVKSWGDVSHLDQSGFLESGFGGDRNSG